MDKGIHLFSLDDGNDIMFVLKDIRSKGKPEGITPSLLPSGP